VQLYLIRHPRPSSAIGLCYGRQDVAVDADSVAHAAATVRERIPRSDLECARIFTSPASRCVLLAREIAAPREPSIAEDLVEMSFGSWEGRPWDQVPREQLDAWSRDVRHYRPGGVESAAMVAERWQRWASLVCSSGEGCAVAVTHAGVIRTALEAAGMLSAATFLQAPVAFGSVHCIDFAHARVPSSCVLSRRVPS
jgi:alpha-ribazole phosphatase